jgi:hypothetical protein
MTRAETARKIAANPGGYKICQGCDSIVEADVKICANCRAYRFESNARLVIAHAMLLGSRARQTPIPEDYQ